jgi:hypothetical protein
MQKLLAALFFAALSTASIAEEMRDYYSEPGLHPFKEAEGQDQTENIDPFSGTLQLQYTDIRVPGNGGMDIVIHRSYTNPQKKPGYTNIFGIGWQIGYGRIVVSATYANGICNVTNTGNTLNNPSVEHPDGARELLVYNDINANGGDGSLITKSNWLARCITPADPTDGMIVTSPDGTRYTMDVESTVYNSEGGLVETSYYTSRIEDVNGNWISLQYGTLPNRGTSIQRYLTRITAGTSAGADGREVTFDYIDQTDQPVGPSSLDVRLFRITNQLTGQPDQVWEFEYEEATTASSLPNMYGLKFYQLAAVTGPDGTEWRYSYFPEIVAVDDSDSLALRTVTYPQGGVITYDYQQVHFYTWTMAADRATHSLYTKTTSGTGITSGTWRYEFLPASFDVSGHDSNLDVTNVYRPDGTRERFIHYGHSYAIGYYDLLWAIGLQHRKETYNASGQVVEVLSNGWDRRRLSGEWYLQGVGNDSPEGADRATWAPLQVSKFTSRYDTNELGGVASYSDFDVYGNPCTITGNAAISSYPDKVQRLTYYNNTTLWIIGKTDTESIDSISGNIDRTFDSLGRVISENRYGVITAHTYTSAGDFASTTDSLARTTYFEDHYRGIPRLERKPEDNIRIVRTVNSAGTVASHNVTSNSDTRNLTRSFTYDALNRLSGIDFRNGADVSISWSGAIQRTLTRGNYRERVDYDGFGRQIRLTRTDLAAGSSIVTNYTFDAMGRKIFESLPNSTTTGIQYAYTPLGDIDRIDYANGDYRDYTYSGEWQMSITDGRGSVTSHYYNSFGLPESDRTLYQTVTGANITLYTYNLFNQVTEVFQGVSNGSGGVSGWGRQFAYDSRHYLIEETHPEITAGNTTNTKVLYQRDAIGNMTGKTIGDSAQIVYGYDNLNRLTLINYATAPDVTFGYSKTGKVRSLSSSTASRTYTYDDNDNLIDEALAIGSNNYALHYAYDNLDAVGSVTYPSGRVVQRAPDAFGRPTRVGNYINSVAYHPSGQWSTLAYANGQTATQTLVASRLWTDTLTVSGASNAVNLDYGYDIVGNVTGIANAITASDSRTLGYDSLNRLTSAQGSWGTETIAYDGRSNISSKGSNVYGYNSQRLVQIQRPGNIYTFFEYDNRARVREEYVYNFDFGFYGYRNSYTLDDADNLTQVARSLNNGVPTIYSYGYDGKNNRVRRTLGSATTHYIYADDGTLMGEYTPGAIATGKEYIYLGTQLIADIKPNQPPIANAGSTQNVTGGNTVTLNGTASSDPDGAIASYTWLQLTGTQVTLTNPGSASPTFTAPQVLGTRTLTFRLAVTDDDGSQGNATVSITSTFTAPDTDGDGIHDAYETANGLNPNNAADANQDMDGDGVSNLNEYLGGTNPRIHNSNGNDIPLPPWAFALLGAGLLRLIYRNRKMQKEVRV